VSNRRAFPSFSFAQLTEENPMRSLIALTLAALSIAACRASIGTPTVVVRE
jgi:hypothetical protein